MYKPLCARKYFEINKINVGLAILNFGSAWFALMFLWILCKELEFSYFVVQPHGFKRKSDEECSTVCLECNKPFCMKCSSSTRSDFKCPKSSCKRAANQFKTFWNWNAGSALISLCMKKTEKSSSVAQCLVDTIFGEHVVNVQEEHSILRSQLEKTKCFLMRLETSYWISSITECIKNC